MPGFFINVRDNCNDPGTVDSESKYQGPQNYVETARKNRYILEILEPLGTKDNGILLFLEKCSRPNVTIDEMVIHSAQDEIFRPGKHHYQTIDLTFYEKLTPLDPPFYNQATQLIYDWWSRVMIDINSSIIAPPSEYLKNAELQMTDGYGTPIWRYMIYDCWPCKISPDEMTYKESEISRITLSLRFSKCFEFVDDEEL